MGVLDDRDVEAQGEHTKLDLGAIAAVVDAASSSKAFGVLVHGYDYYISYAFVGEIILPE